MKPQLAVIRGCVIDTYANGMLVEIVGRVRAESDWKAPDGFIHTSNRASFAVRSLGGMFRNETEFGLFRGFSEFGVFPESRVFPINDNPGNEYFFKAAPLDAKQPDRGVTITERGEVV